MNKGVIIGCSIAGAVLLVVAMCGGLVAVVVSSAVGAMSAVSKPADDLLTLLGNGDTTGAYQSGASGLRAAETPEQFAAFVKSSRLDQYRSSNWNKFNVVNSQGTLEGTVTLKDGSSVPLKVSLVNEGGWKVLGMELTGGAGATVTPPARPSVPSDAELKKLVNRDMSEFRKASRGQDFTRFHSTLAEPFREKYTAEALSGVYEAYRDRDGDLAAVEAIDPTITKPATLDANGVLKVEGEYPARPAAVVFEIKYLFENGEWKVLGFYIKLRATE